MTQILALAGLQITPKPARHTISGEPTQPRVCPLWFICSINQLDYSMKEATL